MANFCSLFISSSTCHVAWALSNSKPEIQDNRSARLLKKILKDNPFQKRQEISFVSAVDYTSRVSVRGMSKYGIISRWAGEGMGFNTSDHISNLYHPICVRDNVYESTPDVVEKGYTYAQIWWITGRWLLIKTAKYTCAFSMLALHLPDNLIGLITRLASGVLVQLYRALNTLGAHCRVVD